MKKRLRNTPSLKNIANSVYRRIIKNKQKTQDIDRSQCKLSISLGNSHRIPAFAGMTIRSKCLSCPRKQESSGWSQNMICPDLLRTYESMSFILI